MKKTAIIILSLAMILGCLAACSDSAGMRAEKLTIVTTTFPIYDWVSNILGDNPGDAELVMLLDSGVDLHNFQPTAEDILKISTCDVFIYVGGESDEWAEHALDEALNKDMTVINLIEALGEGAKEEEIVEGMEHDHEHEEGEDHEEGEEHDHDEETEYDEHVWLSLRNASFFVNTISTELSGKDPDNGKLYLDNAASYVEKIDALDKKYEETVASLPGRTLLFGDRFPFRYLTDDYGLNYYAAFSGCSAETEASFETISFLSSKMDELSLKVVMTIEGTNHKIAETIIQNTETKDQSILILDSMQSITANDVKNGVKYLDIMEHNLEVLGEALK